MCPCPLLELGREPFILARRRRLQAIRFQSRRRCRLKRDTRLLWRFPATRRNGPEEPGPGCLRREPGDSGVYEQNIDPPDPRFDHFEGTIQIRHWGDVRSKSQGPVTEFGCSPRDGFSVDSVGIDRIIEESGVAKMTFYQHFPSKARLIAEYLAEKERNWQRLLAEFTGDEAKSPVEKLLAIFDALESAIRDAEFRGCPFIRALAKFGPERHEPEVKVQILRHFSDLEKVVWPLLKQARGNHARKLLHPMMSLITGTIVVAQATGDAGAASRNKAAAEALLEQTEL